MKNFRRLLLMLLLAAVLMAGGTALLYRTIPQSNTQLEHFDTIIVLGAPANPDGGPSPEQRERVLEGVREYRRGVAPRIIMTGAAAHNRFVEADVMAALAGKHGVPAEAIIKEPHARNTIQNAYYSVQIMRAHRWHSAEVVSSSSHLPRASLIFSHFPVEWRMHPAPWPSEYLRERYVALYTAEALYSSKLRVLGFTSTPFLPR